MNEPGYALVGDAGKVGMTPLACPELTDLLLLLLDKSKGFGAYDILCFLFGKPSFSETWTPTLHFIVLKNIIQAYKLPMSFSFAN